YFTARVGNPPFAQASGIRVSHRHIDHSRQNVSRVETHLCLPMPSQFVSVLTFVFPVVTRNAPTATEPPHRSLKMLLSSIYTGPILAQRESDALPRQSSRRSALS